MDADQQGSTVTDEKLRFDFAYGRSLTTEQLEQVELIVNQQIQVSSKQGKALCAYQFLLFLTPFFHLGISSSLHLLGSPC